jgi:P-type E1-E2 ATPase
VIVLISALNDYKKQGQFRALSDFSRGLNKVTVTRDGLQKQVCVEELVVGDIVNIVTGDVMPTDGVLLQGFNLSMDESTLTGKSPFLLFFILTDSFVCGFFFCSRK